MRLAALLIGDQTANRVVPPSGFTALLTLVSAGAMAFLAVFAISVVVSVVVDVTG